MAAMFCLTVLETASSNLMCGQGWSFLGTMREGNALGIFTWCAGACSPVYNSVFSI